MIRLLRPKNIVPLEVWDVLTPWGPLYALRDAALADGVVAMVTSLSRGQARRTQTGNVLPAVAFNRVVVGGGGDVDAVVVALAAAGVAARTGDDGAFTGVVGGLAVVDGDGDGDALIVDVGQTSIKRWYRGQRLRWPRPEALPVGEADNEVPRSVEQRRDGRARAVAFIADALRTSTSPSRIILGLPCELSMSTSGHVIVGGCSYPWDDGDDALVDDVVAAAAVADDVDVAVENDAVLAACAGVADGDSDGDGGTLVLTLGLGVGAALRSR